MGLVMSDVCSNSAALGCGSCTSSLIRAKYQFDTDMVPESGFHSLLHKIHPFNTLYLFGNLFLKY